MKFLVRIFVLISMIVLLSNCVAVQPFPGIARAGDTTTLAVGSLDGINTNISFYSDNNPFFVTL